MKATSPVLLVSVLGSEVTPLVWLPTPLAVGDRVLLLRSEGVWHVVGLRTARPSEGTVSSTGSGVVTVSTGVGPVTVPHVGGVPVVGDRVALLWGSAGGVVVGRIGTPSAPPPPSTPPSDPTPPQTDPAPAPATVAAGAVQAATARSGRWRSDGTAGHRAYQGHSTSGQVADNTGYFFYGSTLARGGTGSSGVVRLYRATGAGMSAARTVWLALHGAATRPSSPPALTTQPRAAGTVAQGGTVDIALTSAEVSALLSGAARGIAVSYQGTTDYMALLGPSDRPDAGRVTLITTI
ncbi:hypothetical protein ACTQ40_10165 [Collinsella sp. Sow4_D11]|uniref:hypothetical protein n=1 Tax=Collinsella sp. Sow4_D11 TaxID=3438775 RepID=UPI003F925160